MNEEYKIIHIVGVGRAIKNKKTGKIYYSEFQIIEEKDKELDQYKNNWEELKKILNEMILDTKKPTVLNNREKIAIRSAIEHILNKMKELEENK